MTYLPPIVINTEVRDTIYYRALINDSYLCEKEFMGVFISDKLEDAATRVDLQSILNLINRYKECCKPELPVIKIQRIVQVRVCTVTERIDLLDHE